MIPKIMTERQITQDFVGVFPENIPDELKRRQQWVSWRVEAREGKLTKVPYNPRTANKASSTDSTTWSTLEVVVSAFESEAYSGIGFVFSSGDPYTGIDFDHCLNRETGEIASWAWKWIERFDGYTEVSPSGDGLHVIVKGKSPRNGKRTVNDKTVEVYSTERFFTCTGVQP
jgi:putative DNA primase/helicase